MPGEHGVMEKLVRKNVVSGEDDVVFLARQRRTANPLFPYYVVLTPTQIVKYKPGLMGHETETRSVSDIDDIDVETGFLSSDVTMESHGLDDFRVEGLPKYRGDALRNEIQKLKQSD